MTTKIFNFSNIEHKLFWFFFGVLVVMIAFYLYSAFSLTVNVVERNRLGRVAHELEVRVGTAEAEYIKLQNSITLETANNLGLHEVVAKFTKEKSEFAGQVSMAR